MPRIRSLKPEIWEDEKAGTLKPRAKLLFIGLITLADDDGRLRGNPSKVKSSVFPYEDDLSSANVQVWLDELQAADLIRQYGSPDGTQKYIQVVNFKRHQRVNRPVPSNLPAPHSNLPNRNLETPQFAGDSVNTHGGLTEDSLRAHCGNGMEWNGTNTSSSENDLDLGAAKEPNPVEGEITQVLHHWKQTYDKPKSAITGPKAKSRRSRVRSRLSEGWTVEELKKALDGHWTRDIIKSNPQYHRIETVLRDSTQVEAGIDQLSSSVPQSYEWRDPFPENDPFGEEPRLG